MISIVVAGAIGLVALQSGIDIPRKNFGGCLSSALDSAMAQKITVADYGAFVLKSCDSQANSLKSGLVGFDVKNGIARTRASADAQAQIDEYLVMAAERYESRVGKPTVAAVAPAVTAVTPASAPKR
ncbi:MAG: hypothetical protein LH485_01580 [Sphingomonas bacterium]|nr:hypothetical protein [Sphingomonas bacterium]